MASENPGESCALVFERRKRAWLWIAIPACVSLLLSITMADTSQGVSPIQIAGLVMLVAFVAASFVLCRCPQCSKFLLDKKDLVPGWGFKECPHCRSALTKARPPR